MTNQEKLKDLLTKEFIPDLEDFIDDIFTTIAETKNEAEHKEDLEESQELLKNFKEIVKDLENGEIEQEECDEILAELEDIRKEYNTQVDEDKDEEEE